MSGDTLPNAFGTGDVWGGLEARFGRARAYLLFACGYLLLLGMDLAFRDSGTGLALLRPSAGLLLAALWISRKSSWAYFLCIHGLCAVLVTGLAGDTAPVAALLSTLFAGPIAAVVGALCGRWLVPVVPDVHVRLVPRLLLAGAAGALSGAVFAVAVGTRGGPAAAGFYGDVLQWWMSSLLGALTIGPLAMAWVLPLRKMHRELTLRSRWELACIILWLLLCVGLNYWVANVRHGSQLVLPVFAGPALVYASFRLPPRWAVSMSALLILCSAATMALRTAPFSVSDGMLRVSLAQVLFGIFASITLIISLLVTQVRISMARLLFERQRLQRYAQRIVAAEEKARRATAVDLHDGIGQTLASMSMMLEVARQQVPGESRQLLDSIQAQLHEVQGRTRRMISDLSPPGLYDLGLEAALQWLAGTLHERDGLKVQLLCQVQEPTITLEMRMLVFKLVRELLRNVIKHSGAGSAQVELYGDGQELRVLVSDEGRGFERSGGVFGTRGAGFGLWSISNRVAGMGGDVRIDSRIGRGTIVELVMPLRVLTSVNLSAAASPAGAGP